MHSAAAWLTGAAPPQACSLHPVPPPPIPTPTLPGPCRWDKEEGCLKESLPNELHQAMPVILVKPVTTEQYTQAGYYSCPVYTNMQRANVYSPLCSMFTLRTQVGGGGEGGPGRGGGGGGVRGMGQECVAQGRGAENPLAGLLYAAGAGAGCRVHGRCTH